MSNEENNSLKIGERSNNGCIFAGISEDNRSPGRGQKLLVFPADEGVMTYDKALGIVKGRQEKGIDVRIPTVSELRQIFDLSKGNNFGDKFNKSAGPAGEYLGNPKDHHYMEVFQFRTGKVASRSLDGTGSLRAVTSDGNIPLTKISI